MTGISEILVLLLLIACILILPRMIKGEPPQKKTGRTLKKMPVKTRISIVLSIVYPLGLAFYLTPWKGDLIPYILFGFTPVLIFWALVWIFAGKKQ